MHTQLYFNLNIFKGVVSQTNNVQLCLIQVTCEITVIIRVLRLHGKNANVSFLSKLIYSLKNSEDELVKLLNI